MHSTASSNDSLLAICGTTFNVDRLIGSPSESSIGLDPSYSHTKVVLCLYSKWRGLLAEPSCLDNGSEGCFREVSLRLLSRPDCWSRMDKYIDNNRRSNAKNTTTAIATYRPVFCRSSVTTIVFPDVSRTRRCSIIATLLQDASCLDSFARCSGSLLLRPKYEQTFQLTQPFLTISTLDLHQTDKIEASIIPETGVVPVRLCSFGRYDRSKYCVATTHKTEKTAWKPKVSSQY